MMSALMMSFHCALLCNGIYMPHATLFVQMLRYLQPSVAVFTTAEVAGAPTRATPPGQLLAAWQAARASCRRCRELIMASVSASVQRAVMEVSAQAEAGQAPVVCVTGSLHAVGDALRASESIGFSWN